jgi:hypothetical protein
LKALKHGAGATRRGHEFCANGRRGFDEGNVERLRNAHHLQRHHGEDVCAGRATGRPSPPTDSARRRTRDVHPTAIDPRHVDPQPLAQTSFIVAGSASEGLV